MGRPVRRPFLLIGVDALTLPDCVVHAFTCDSVGRRLSTEDPNTHLGRAAARSRVS